MVFPYLSNGSMKWTGWFSIPRRLLSPSSWGTLLPKVSLMHIWKPKVQMYRIMRVATIAKQRDDGAIRDIDRVGNTAFFHRRDTGVVWSQIVDDDKFLEKDIYTVKRPPRTFPCNNNWIIFNDDTQLFVTHIFCLIPGGTCAHSLVIARPDAEVCTSVSPTSPSKRTRTDAPRWARWPRFHHQRLYSFSSAKRRPALQPQCARRTKDIAAFPFDRIDGGHTFTFFYQTGSETKHPTTLSRWYRRVLCFLTFDWSLNRPYLQQNLPPQ